MIKKSKIVRKLKKYNDRYEYEYNIRFPWGNAYLMCSNDKELGEVGDILKIEFSDQGEPFKSGCCFFPQLSLTRSALQTTWGEDSELDKECTTLFLLLRICHKFSETEFYTKEVIRVLPWENKEKRIQEVLNHQWADYEKSFNIETSEYETECGSIRWHLMEYYTVSDITFKEFNLLQ